MKAWLGLRDTERVYETSSADTRFGIASDEHGFARVRLA
jgi:hypothetical protein